MEICSRVSASVKVGPWFPLKMKEMKLLNKSVKKPN